MVISNFGFGNAAPGNLRLAARWISCSPFLQHKSAIRPCIYSLFLSANHRLSSHPWFDALTPHDVKEQGNAHQSRPWPIHNAQKAPLPWPRLLNENCVVRPLILSGARTTGSQSPTAPVALSSRPLMLPISKACASANAMISGRKRSHNTMPIGIHILLDWYKPSNNKITLAIYLRMYISSQILPPTFKRT